MFSSAHSNGVLPYFLDIAHQSAHISIIASSGILPQTSGI